MSKTQDGNSQKMVGLILPDPLATARSDPLPAEKGKPKRDWVFTCNNYTEKDIEIFKNCDARYKIWGYEVGKKFKTPHMQGYLYFKTEKSFKQMKELHSTCYWAKARGDSLHNFNYSSKDGNVYEEGKRPKSRREIGQAEQDRWENIYQLAIAGKWDEIPRKDMIRHYTRLQQLRVTFGTAPEPLDTCCGVWIYGPPGTGKTTMAKKLGLTHLSMEPSKWLAGYTGQEVLILEDFDKSHKDMAWYLKIWADKYPFLAQTKGSHQWARPKVVCVTSNFHPNEIWYEGKLRDAIKDRFIFKEVKGENYRAKEKRKTVDEMLDEVEERKAKRQKVELEEDKKYDEELESKKKQFFNE